MREEAGEHAGRTPQHGRTQNQHDVAPARRPFAGHGELFLTMGLVVDDRARVASQPEARVRSARREALRVVGERRSSGEEEVGRVRVRRPARELRALLGRLSLKLGVILNGDQDQHLSNGHWSAHFGPGRDSQLQSGFNGADTVPMVRAAWNDQFRIKQLLDMASRESWPLWFEPLRNALRPGLAGSARAERQTIIGTSKSTLPPRMRLSSSCRKSRTWRRSTSLRNILPFPELTQ
jgi:hypothetical protein